MIKEHIHQPLPASIEPTHTTTAGRDEILVDEIACTLREWGFLLKQYLKQQKYDLFNTIRELFQILFQGRRQLLARTLSDKELVNLRYELIQYMDEGNRLQNLDFILRDPETGKIIDIKKSRFSNEESTSNYSVLQIYRMHMMKSEEEEEHNTIKKPKRSNTISGRVPSDINTNIARTKSDNNNFNNGPASAPVISNNNTTFTSSTPLQPTKFSHLFFEFHKSSAVFCTPGEYSEYSVALFNRIENRYVSETFIFKLNAFNLPYTENKPYSQLRTLFVDLSHRDLNDNIYLVIKIVRVGRMNMSDKDLIKSSDSSNTSASTINMTSTMSLVPGNPNGMVSFRRPYGCAIMELGSILLNKQEIKPEYTLRIYVPTQENQFSTMHENIINQNNLGYEIRPYSISISINIFNGITTEVITKNKDLFTATTITPRHGFSDIILPGDFRNGLYLTLASGDFQQGRKASGRNICVNIRVRMNSGNFIPDCIRRGSGGENISEYESVVYYHCNQPKWQETIRIDLSAEQFEKAHILFLFRYCSTKEKITDRSERLFGYSFLPLVRRNNTVINDSLHNLCIYRYDKKLEHPSVYLYYQNNIKEAQANEDTNSITNNKYDEVTNNNNTQVFSTTGNKNENSIAEQASRIVELKDTFNVRTALCSTNLTQNVALLNLLHWNDRSQGDIDKLSNILKEYTLISEIEIIKFIKNILDALFSILSCDLNLDGKLNNLVMNGLVFTLGIIMDKRFTNYRIYVDEYIEGPGEKKIDNNGKFFKFPNVWENLITAFHKLLSDPVSPNSAKEIRNAIKVQQYIFKFIIQSHKLFLSMENDHQPDEVLDQINADLNNRLNIIFESFNKMMELTEPDAIIGSQTLTLQYMPTLISDLLNIYNKYELSKIVISFIDSTKNNKSKIIGYKLTFIYHLLCSPLYDSMESRPLLTKAIIRWIMEYLNREWVISGNSSKSDGSGIIHSSNSNVNISSSGNLASSPIDTSLTLSNLVTLYGSDNLRLCFLVIAELIDRFSYPDADDNENYNNDNIEGATDALLNNRISMASSKLINQKHISPIVIMNGLLPKILNIYASILINKRTDNCVPKVRERGRRRSPIKHQLVNMVRNTDLGELTMIILVLFCNLTDKEVAHFFLAQYKEGEKEKKVKKNMDGGGVETVCNLLTQHFTIFESMLTSEHIPSNWVVPNILMHKIIVSIMRPISGLMRYMFIPKKNIKQNFNSAISELWHNYFNVLISLLNSPYVQIEKFSPQKRRASALLKGDIRDVASEMLLKMWKYLNIKDEENYQNIFNPNLLGPLFELSMSPNNSVRAASIEMIFNMIENEYKINHHFNYIQLECIDKMDRLVMGEGKGDESYRRFFIDALDAKLSSSHTPVELRDSGLQFLSSMDEFLRLMLNVRDLTELGKESSSNLWETERMQGTLKLMKWMKVIDSKNIYLKYVYSLYEMHKNNQNFIEAGYTLKLHADLLEWNTEKKLSPMPEYGFDSEESSFERKEKLYLKIIECFETSKAWEKAISLCKELAYQYETISINYNKISEMLKREAKLYEYIATEDRYFSNYFRVGFYGAKWHSTLRNKQFVYRGIEWEKIGPFCERIVNRYPNSQLLRSNQPPDREIKFGDILYIQITAIQPEPSAEYSVLDNYPDYIRKYYESNEVRTFSFNRPFKKQKDKKTNSENEFMDLWTEKTILITENKFPSLLRRSEVIYLKIIELSPIENGVLTLIAKNRELNMAKERYEKAEKAINHGQDIPLEMRLSTGGVNINPLTMLLNGAVDARVNGGVPMYRNAFLCPEFKEQNPEYDYLVVKMKKLIEEQAVIIHDTLILHDRLVTLEMRPLHENLIKSFYVTFGNEIETLNLSNIEKTKSESKLVSHLPSSSNGSSTITSPPQSLTPGPSSQLNPARAGVNRHSSFSISAASIYGTAPRNHQREKSEASALFKNRKDQQVFISLSNLPTEKLKHNGSLRQSFKKKISTNSVESSSGHHSKYNSQGSEFENSNTNNMNSISEVNIEEFSGKKVSLSLPKFEKVKFEQ
ncbi:hypothetical protein H8356DRAFT_1281091 [Neocallimastix lanati (nom. inval.)]|nr:hypothetical protein H8356DRAFT_1281091 [Neocallimastix sp. JGI-2020a]